MEWEASRIASEAAEGRDDTLHQRLTGFYAGLTVEQKSAAIAYDGPENFGEKQAEPSSPPTQSAE